MNWQFLTQMRCAFLGTHSVTDEEEDRLFENEYGRILSYCKYCGITLGLERINDEEYEMYWNFPEYY